ncbi:MAG: UDP-N-acetylmuramoyl-tripeptide--D-alanyl-D-alanine ligase [Pirellulales bacterium]|nr:UDP-N-acetylmuramoyl-tripeptide--D-alanyl-D-alanine ligase [Pirellulales bacterium]
MDMITLQTLGELVGGVRRQRDDAAPASPDAPLERLVTDSSQIDKGDIYWALGDRPSSDPARAWEAYARGAVGVVAATGATDPCGDGWLLEVEEPRRALVEFARWQRSGFTGTVVAVAGSVGKTTTRDMIDCVLSHRQRGLVGAADAADPTSLALDLLALDERHEHAVFELSADEGGHVGGLATLCAPHIGVITSLDYLEATETNGGRQALEAQVELLARLSPDGLAVLNGDDPGLRRLAARSRAKILWVGRRADGDLVATRVRARRGMLSFEVEGCEISIPVWGRHHLTAALLAIGVGRAMGLAMNEIASALAEFDPPPMRCQMLDRAGVRIVSDAYNDNPVAMQAALELLRDCDARGRRFVVCGDLPELGDNSPKQHRRLGDQVVTLCGADVLVACGPHAAEIVSGAREAGMPSTRTLEFHAAEDALPTLNASLRPGDVLLWKGSRREALDQLIAGLAPARNTWRLVA